MKMLNILIVDDSMAMRRMVRRVVELTEIAIGNIHEAANGREALDVLAEHQVDALFTDLNMPVMNGIELLQALDGHHRPPSLRVVISSDGSDARRRQAEGLRVTRYLDKPVRPEVMRDVLCELHHEFGK
jgi:two-component system chemotaxis response regulator CheY